MPVFAGRRAGGRIIGNPFAQNMRCFNCSGADESFSANLATHTLGAAVFAGFAIGGNGNDGFLGVSRCGNCQTLDFLFVHIKIFVATGASVVPFHTRLGASGINLGDPFAKVMLVLFLFGACGKQQNDCYQQH